MASAGTVTVDFAAEVAKFNAQLKTVQTSLKGLEGGMESVSRVASAFGSVLSAAAIGAFARSVFLAADELADSAKRAGVAVESLSRLKFAAEQADVEFSELTVGLRNFQRNLSEAQDGIKSATGTFQLLGIQARELSKLSLEEQLAEIADAFQFISDPADKTRIAMELFGRSGAALIPLLEQGSAGIRELSAEADRLGITMTESAAAGIDQADAAIKRLKATLQAGGTKFLAGLSIFFLGAPGQIEEINKQVEELARQRDLILARVPDTALREQRIAAINAQIDELIAKQKELIGLGDNLILPKLDVDVGTIDVTPDTRALDEAFAEKRRKEAEAEEAARIAKLQQNEEFANEEREQMERLREQINADTERFTNQQLDIARNAEEERMQIIIQSEQQIQAVREGAMNAGLGLLRALAVRSKTAAVALIAINRGLQIAQAIQNTAAAVTNALANVPYPANLAAAAQIKAIGAAQVALIAATGFVEARNALSGSGGIPLGSPHNPVFTDTAEQAQFGASSQNAVQVIIANNVGFDQHTMDQIIEGIREAVDDRDVIIFGPDSLQAQQVTVQG